MDQKLPPPWKYCKKSSVLSLASVDFPREAFPKGVIQKTKTGKLASKRQEGGGSVMTKKTQLFPQKVILMQYRPKIQEYRPSGGKKGRNGGWVGEVSDGVVFFGRNFSRLSFLNNSLREAPLKLA